MRAIVVGAGISGLTCAHRLRSAGHDVRIVTREPSAKTTSAVAAAIWTPYAVASDRVAQWSRESYDAYAAQAEDPNSAVSMVPLRILQAHDTDLPSWTEGVRSLERLADADVPEGYAGGFSFVAPLAEMPTYLLRLATQLAADGVQFEHRTVDDVDQELRQADVVVNCAGLGARELVGDSELYPIRGQLVTVTGATLPHALIDDDGPDGLCYVVPRGDDIVLGGTAEAGEQSLAVDQEQSESIRRRCTERFPQLAAAQVERAVVGLRPGRPRIRLEAEVRGEGLVIHDYGHGGAGMTLAWGCADEVLALATAQKS